MSIASPPSGTTSINARQARDGDCDCDVLIVGGGINGCGIARDLAGRGWRVTLVEQDDLASHTSSSSTKLIHGGLRYLEYYEFGLVRKALQEREVLLRSAPHIMWPLRFVMPHDPSMRPAWLIRLGLIFYDHLARVIRRDGLLFHYTGTPNKITSGRDVPREVRQRLEKAGFQAEIRGDGVLARHRAGATATRSQRPRQARR